MTLKKTAQQKGPLVRDGPFYFFYVQERTDQRQHARTRSLPSGQIIECDDEPSTWRGASCYRPCDDDATWAYLTPRTFHACCNAKPVMYSNPPLTSNPTITFSTLRKPYFTQRPTPNAKRPTSNAQRQTPNAQRQTPHVKSASPGSPSSSPSSVSG